DKHEFYPGLLREELAVGDNQIGNFTGLDGSQPVVDAEYTRCGTGSRPQCSIRYQPGLDTGSYTLQKVSRLHRVGRGEPEEDTLILKKGCCLPRRLAVPQLSKRILKIRIPFALIRRFREVQANQDGNGGFFQLLSQRDGLVATDQNHFYLVFARNLESLADPMHSFGREQKRH